MTDKSVTLALLTEYERTADLLCSGAVVSPEMLARYHGTTGVLLARVVRTLWSQSELDAAIDARLLLHGSECKKRCESQAKTWREAMLQNARAIIIGATIIILAAIALGRVSEIAAVIDRVVMRSEVRQ